MRIPIAAAKRIADEYGVDQVVILARSVGVEGREHVVTYGRTIKCCDVAAQMGNKLKEILGWPPDMCQDKPARIRRREPQP